MDKTKIYNKLTPGFVEYDDINNAEAPGRIIDASAIEYSTNTEPFSPTFNLKLFLDANVELVSEIIKDKVNRVGGDTITGNLIIRPYAISATDPNNLSGDLTISGQLVVPKILANSVSLNSLFAELANLGDIVTTDITSSYIHGDTAYLANVQVTDIAASWKVSTTEVITYRVSTSLLDVYLGATIPALTAETIDVVGHIFVPNLVDSAQNLTSELISKLAANKYFVDNSISTLNSSIRAAITEEVDSINTDIKNFRAAVTDKIDSIDIAMLTETTLRTAAVNSEKLAREADIGTCNLNIAAVSEAVDTEIRDRKAAVSECLSDCLASIAAVSIALVTEASDRAVNNGTVTANITAVSNALSGEITARTSAITDCLSSIDIVEGLLDLETTNRSNADTALTGRINAVSDKVSSEITTRTEAVSVYTASIQAVSDKVDSEIGTRTAEVRKLNTDVTSIDAHFITEHSERIAAEAAITTSLNTAANSINTYIAGMSETINTTFAKVGSGNTFTGVNEFTNNIIAANISANTVSTYKVMADLALLTSIATTNIDGSSLHMSHANIDEIEADQITATVKLVVPNPQSGVEAAPKSYVDAVDSLATSLIVEKSNSLATDINTVSEALTTKTNSLTTVIADFKLVVTDALSDAASDTTSEIAANIKSLSDSLAIAAQNYAKLSASSNTFLGTIYAPNISATLTIYTTSFLATTASISTINAGIVSATDILVNGATISVANILGATIMQTSINGATIYSASLTLAAIAATTVSAAHIIDLSASSVTILTASIQTSLQVPAPLNTMDAVPKVYADSIATKLSTAVTELLAGVLVWLVDDATPNGTLNTNLVPSINWTTNTEKDKHINDILYYKSIYTKENATDIIEHNIYTYLKDSNSNYSWQEILTVNVQNRAADLLASATPSPAIKEGSVATTIGLVTFNVKLSKAGYELTHDNSAALTFKHGSTVLTAVNIPGATDSFEVTIPDQGSIPENNSKSYTIEAFYGSRHDSVTGTAKFGQRVYWYINANKIEPPDTNFLDLNHPSEGCISSDVCILSSNKQTYTAEIYDPNNANNTDITAYVYYVTPYEVSNLDNFKVGGFSGGFVSYSNTDQDENYVYRTVNAQNRGTITIEVS